MKSEYPENALTAKTGTASVDVTNFVHQVSETTVANKGNNGLGTQGYQSGYGPITVPGGTMDAHLGLMRSGPEYGPNQSEMGTMMFTESNKTMQEQDMVQGMSGKTTTEASRIGLARKSDTGGMAEDAGTAAGFSHQASMQ